MTANFIFKVLEALAAIIVPVATIYYIKNKKGGRLRNVFDGAAVFLIFYCLIFAVVATCIEFMTPLYEKVESELWLIIINVFFETLCIILGYKLWFKCVIKKKDDNSVGLMTGAGFAFARTIFAHGITAVLSVIAGNIYIKNGANEIPPILESNLEAFIVATSYYGFLLLIQLISVFVLETAFAFVIYRVNCCENAKYWSFIAFVLRIAAIVLLKSGIYLERTVIVFIVLTIAVILSAIGYSLYKPFVRKTGED